MRDNEGGTHPASDVERKFWRPMSADVVGAWPSEEEGGSQCF